MQTKRQWDSKTKSKIAAEGLQERNVVDICMKYEISQSRDCKWHNIFLARIEQPLKQGQRARKSRNWNRKIHDYARL